MLFLAPAEVALSRQQGLMSYEKKFNQLWKSLFQICGIFATQKWEKMASNSSAGGLLH